jgi:CDP-diacylglycerol--glycerol-3-phosphate 3-phosphatidyltransferase
VNYRQILTAPNQLTLLRMIFLPFIVINLVKHDFKWALALFILAGMSDGLDGLLARTLHQQTLLGQYLDPIADKLLISAALISLVQIHVLPGWMAVLIIGREFAVSGLRSIAAAEGYTIKASDLGKTKMFSQVVAISVMLPSVRHPGLRPVGMALMWGVVFFSLVSAVSYFGKFWHKVDESVKNRRRRELLTLERKRQRAMMRQRRSSRTGGSAGALGSTIWKPPEVN